MEHEHALALLAWARIWSPLAEAAAREEAWAALGLPDTFSAVSVEYWTGCHGPQAPLSLLLHAALGLDGSATREDWLRVMDHLDLAWDGVHLPPDQLGVACEVFACAIDAAEPVLVRELCARYLLPWCDTALARLPAGSAMGPVLDQFRADVTLASAHPH
ncbi:MAG: hypothetical protein IPJ33_15815 [Gammaproteobacteria bacterium]|jgi:hypothetical protein|nr:hypothetical protein [Gammaproteobacteria bacterium]MBP6053559.1 hypothetical protein [Pseudomonadales bacterium]MBK6583211.1 hypothetical protein [Gammaproteobacteria bacterium]MBK7170674.1 hypothetical protein [Gammaproteobacteria bacterium]MBK7519345.1 hypothetical protein [Gammaproteobacteria bacterium]